MDITPRILLVEDEPATLKLLASCLESAHYCTTTATNGYDAWETLTSSPYNFSLVITDRVMPKLDGIALTRQIKSQPAFKHLPVIMLTSAAEREEVISAVQGGVYDFLMKPIEEELLLMVVKRALQSRLH